jgi:UDP-N-acetylmuramate-alanine ligase
MVEEKSKVPVVVAGDLEEAGEVLARLVAPGDVVFTLGAGDVWRVGEAWLVAQHQASQV